MQADTSTRLRLVEILTPGGALPIGGGFACVFATPSARSAAARFLATTVVGPRPAGADGTIEIAGRYVSVRSLPSPLLAPSAPSVLGPEALKAQWRSVWNRRRDDLGAAHASRRLARHRAEAALERARVRGDHLIAPPAPAAPVVLENPNRARIEELQGWLASLSPIASPAAFELAEEWDTHVRAEPAPAPPLSLAANVDLEGARNRVKAARAAMSMVQCGLSTDDQARIDRLHRDVCDAEVAVSDARRRERSGALARYEAAVRAEHEALAEAGLDSYASFLVEVAGGVRSADPTARNHAARELAEAEAALAVAERGAAPVQAPEPTEDAGYAEREVELRARAAELLGRFPGPDVAGELRALRVEHHDVAPISAEIARLEAEPIVMPVAPPFAPPVTKPSRADEYEALLLECEAHAAAVAELEAELSRLDRTRDADLFTLDREDLVLAVSALLDAYRRGDLLAGRLPVVLDGTLDGIDPEPRRAAVALLAGAQDVQTILVTDDPTVADAVESVGGTVLLWPEPGRMPTRPAPTAPPTFSEPVAPPPAEYQPQAPPRPVEYEPVPPPPAQTLLPSVAVPIPEPIIATPVPTGPAYLPEGYNPRCAMHSETESVAQCAQCERQCCIDCLVYLIGEPDLWCAACARQTDAPGSKPARTTRRRGA